MSHIDANSGVVNSAASVSKIRRVGWLKGWALLDRGESYEIKILPGKGLLGKISGWTYHIAMSDISLELPLVSHYTSLRGRLSDDREVSYSSLGTIINPSSLLSLHGGRFQIGPLEYDIRPVSGKASLAISTEKGESVAIAKKPWQDSETETDWIIEWKVDIHDEGLRLAILLAPWIMDRITDLQTSC